jgi:hypothetical protein
MDKLAFFDGIVATAGIVSDNESARVREAVHLALDGGDISESLKMVGLDEAAEILRISDRTCLRDILARNNITKIKLGNSQQSAVRIRLSDLKRLVDDLPKGTF